MSNAALVEGLVKLLVEKSHAVAAFDMVEPVELRGGATDEELAALDAHLGRPIPPSLRALLRITNGAPNLLAFSDFLSIADMLPGSLAHARSEALKRTLVDGAPVVPAGALVIADKRGDQPDCVYLDPAHVSGEGEWRVVSFDHESDDAFYDSVVGLLERAARTFQVLLDEAKELAAELE